MGFIAYCPAPCGDRDKCNQIQAPCMALSGVWNPACDRTLHARPENKPVCLTGSERNRLPSPNQCSACAPGIRISDPALARSSAQSRDLVPGSFLPRVAAHHYRPGFTRLWSFFKHLQHVRSTHFLKKRKNMGLLRFHAPIRV